MCCCRAFCRTHFLVLGKNLFYIEKEGGKLERFEIYEWHVLYRNSEQSCCCCCKRRGNNSFKFLSRDFCEPERANASFPARAKHHAISRQPRALTQHTHTLCNNWFHGHNNAAQQIKLIRDTCVAIESSFLNSAAHIEFCYFAPRSI